MHNEPTISQYEKLRLLTVDCTRGKVYSSNGQELGFTHSDGYCYISVCARRFFRAHVIWWRHCGRWPQRSLDHRNQNKSDDRIINLREATRSLNMFNKSYGEGVLPRGVHLSGSKKNPYLARIAFRRRKVHIGLYPTVEEALAARIAKEKELGIHEWVPR